MIAPTFSTVSTRWPPARWTGSSRAQCSARKTFVERVGDVALAPLAAAGDFAYVDPDEPAAHGRILAVRAANPGRPYMEVIRANETMMRAMAVFVRRALRGARPVTTAAAPGSGRRRLPRPAARWGMR